MAAGEYERIFPRPRHSPDCAGCLGSGECWVCVGLGLVDLARGHVVPCHRCGGTGTCVEAPSTSAVCNSNASSTVDR